jgi:hypothetical protein
MQLKMENGKIMNILLLYARLCETAYTHMWACMRAHTLFKNISLEGDYDQKFVKHCLKSEKYALSDVITSHKQ